MSAFADPEIIRLAQDEFVPVTGDDWYQRRRADAEGAFFRAMSDQTERKSAGANGTRQGIYVVTADGLALSFKNAGQLTDQTRKELKKALAKFEQLPRARRAPGAVKVPPMGAPDANSDRRVPAGGLAVKVNARILERVGGEFEPGKCDSLGGGGSARDFLWLTADEVKAMLPARSEVGFRYPLPAPVATRIARFHLVDFTRGEPPFWTRDEIRNLDLTLTVTAVRGDAIDLRLDGTVLCATAADPAKAERGFDARLTGRFSYDGTRFTRFDLAAVGDHWGQGPLVKGARPGRSPLGVTFGPVIPPDGDPSDRVPPQAARDLAEYFGRR